MFLYLAATLVVCMFIYACVNQPISKGMPPGPKGLPLVGKIFDMVGKAPNVYFHQLSKKHGKLFSIQIGFHRMLIINSYDLLQEAFVNQGDIFSYRDRASLLNIIMEGRGIVMSVGKRWQKLRKVVSNTLKRFMNVNKRIEYAIDFELQFLLERIQNAKAKPLNPRAAITTSVLNTTWNICTNERFEQGDSKLDWFIRSIESTFQIVKPVGPFSHNFGIQIMGLMCNPATPAVAYSTYKRLKTFNEIIEKHKQKMDQNDNEDDLINHYLEEAVRQPSADRNAYFTDENLKWLLSDLFIAGLETTASAIRFALYCILINPEIQKKLRAEILETLGSDRVAVLQDKQKMPYMTAMLAETLRYSCVVPIIPHATCDDTVLAGYHIPKNTIVLGNLYAVCFDEEIWGDPEEFRPERFLNEEGQYVANMYNIPFSVGRRKCVGEVLSRSELFLFLVGILQKFRLVNVPGQDLAKVKCLTTLTRCLTEFEIIFEPL